MAFLFGHTRFGFCWWDLPAFIILLVIIVYAIVKSRKAKKEIKELEEQLEQAGAVTE